MADQAKKPAFTPSMSKRSTTLETLSKAQIFDRYIVKEYVNVNSDFYKELNTYAANGDFKYPFITSLVGDNVNLFGTMLELKNKTYLPEGYKLNMTNIFADVEKIFEENRSKVKEAIDQNLITPFTRGVINYISQKISSSYTLNDDLTFKVGD